MVQEAALVGVVLDPEQVEVEPVGELRQPELEALLDGVFSGRGLYLYVH